MTLVQLEYALAVARAGSIVGAAELCRVTQPTLTQQLRKLEDELGGALFARGAHPLQPTALGRRVLARAARVRSEADALAALAKDETGPDGPLRVGVIPSIAGSLLPRVVPAFLKRHPAVLLQMEEWPSHVLVRALLEGRLDAAVASVPMEARGLKSVPLYREDFVAYLPPRHPLLSGAAVEPSELARASLLVMGEGHCFRHQVLRLCKAPPPKAGFHFESGSFQTLVALVDQGLGATILPRHTAEDLDEARRRRLRPLAGPAAVRQVALLQARPPARERAAAALAALIRESMPGGAEGRVLPSGVRVEGVGD